MRKKNSVKTLEYSSALSVTKTLNADKQTLKSLYEPKTNGNASKFKGNASLHQSRNTVFIRTSLSKEDTAPKLVALDMVEQQRLHDKTEGEGESERKHDGPQKHMIKSASDFSII